MKKKGILAALLATTMISPSFSVFAEEMIEEASINFMDENSEVSNLDTTLGVNVYISAPQTDKQDGAVNIIFKNSEELGLTTSQNNSISVVNNTLKKQFPKSGLKINTPITAADFELMTWPDGSKTYSVRIKASEGTAPNYANASLPTETVDSQGRAVMVLKSEDYEVDATDPTSVYKDVFETLYTGNKINKTNLENYLNNLENYITIPYRSVNYRYSIKEETSTVEVDNTKGEATFHLDMVVTWTRQTPLYLSKATTSKSLENAPMDIADEDIVLEAARGSTPLVIGDILDDNDQFDEKKLKSAVKGAGTTYLQFFEKNYGSLNDTDFSLVTDLSNNIVFDSSNPKNDPYSVRKNWPYFPILNVFDVFIAATPKKENSNDNSSNNSSASNSSSTSSSSSSSNSSSDSSSNGNGGSSTVTTSKPKLSVTAGSIIEKTEGSLNNKELKALENYVEAHNNPYGYEFTISNASVSTKDGQSTFTMSVTAKLDDESRVDLTIRNLKKRNRSEDAMVEEDEFVELSDLEEMEAASLDYDYVYDKDGDGKKVVIKGIAAKDAFRINDNLNGTSVRTILNNAGYKVSNLNFNSSAKKNHTFSVKDLNDPISIEVTTSTQSSTVSKPSTPVGGDGIIQLPSAPSQPTAPAPTVVAQKSVYRFFNTLTGEHFYTSSEAERNELLKDNRWNYEGQAWTAPESSEYIIYRVCNPNTGEHHFTMDKNEYDTLQTKGWRGEGTGFYSANPSDENIVHLYRLYNPKANNAGSHHYTASEIERDNLVKDGWNYEGVAWYGLK